jgi:hypothetical protein
VADLKAQLVASNEPVVRPKTFINTSQSTQVPVSMPFPLLALSQGHAIHLDSASFVPTITNLRADAHLRAQAE